MIYFGGKMISPPGFTWLVTPQGMFSGIELLEQLNSADG